MKTFYQVLLILLATCAVIIAAAIYGWIGYQKQIGAL